LRYFPASFFTPLVPPPDLFVSGFCGPPHHPLTTVGFELFLLSQCFAFLFDLPPSADLNVFYISLHFFVCLVAFGVSPPVLTDLEPPRELQRRFTASFAGGIAPSPYEL